MRTSKRSWLMCGTLRGGKDSSRTRPSRNIRNTLPPCEPDRYCAWVLPADKARIVRELTAEDPTAFVGDWIIDAPALLEPNLDVASGRTNVAIESADLVLADDPQMWRAPWFLSRATHRKMVQNLAWATGHNTIAIPPAAGVAVSAGILLKPAVGALFMSLSMAG